VGADPTTDVAVIRIEDAGELPVLPLGDSDEVRVGEWVIAIGNPGFGGGSQLDYTVTAGIVSAMGRPLQLLGRELQQDPRLQGLAISAIENFLQTDAVINPGNSGGPMIDLRGRVVGINSAIASQTGFYQGYGFAIPVNLARRVMDDLIRYGEVRRPVLGVEIATVGPEDAEYYRLPSVAGVLVQRLPEDGPARRAGLEPGDVIVAVEGQEVATVGELQQTVAERRPGERVRVAYYRDGQRHEAEVTLGENTIAASRAQAGGSGAADSGASRPARAELGVMLGVEVQSLDEALARRLGFARPGGAVVVGVDAYGPAGRRGLRAPVRILEINDEEIDEAEDVQEILRGLTPGSIASLEVEDPSGSRSIINIRIPG
jgi:serine protease Do